MNLYRRTLGNFVGEIPSREELLPQFKCFCFIFVGIIEKVFVPTIGIINSKCIAV